jgi:hypothetical protein
LNIFVTSVNPLTAAYALDDTRFNSQLRESAQILCTSLRLRLRARDSPEPMSLYKATHPHHPCVIWATASWKNFDWLWDHYNALGHGWGKPHGAFTDSLVASIIETATELGWQPNRLIADQPENFVNCARNLSIGVDFTHLTSVTDAYQEYLNYRWAFTDKRPPRWTRGNTMPVWVTWEVRNRVNT